MFKVDSLLQRNYRSFILIVTVFYFGQRQSIGVNLHDITLQYSLDIIQVFVLVL